MDNGRLGTLLAAAVVAPALALAAPAASAAAGPAGPAGPATDWVVTLAPGADVDELDDLDATRIGPRDVAVDALTARDAAALAAEPGVVAVERDEPAVAAGIPIDPCYLGVGCPVAGTQSGLVQVRAPAAWSVVDGAPGVVVAVVDAAVDLAHPDLAGRVTAPPCAATDGVDHAASSHGTRVAGLIAAAGDDRGIAGVAWSAATVRSYVALGPDLQGRTSDVAAAIHCAVDGGADVINLSLSAGDTLALRNALDRAAAAGVVVVAAAGNGLGDTLLGPMPAAYPSVLAVTALDGDGRRRAPFANGGPWVDLAAPGTGVVSTAPGGGWSVADGTSYAAPLVSGAAALVLARQPALDAAGVRDHLLRAAEPLDDRSTGAGLLDVSGAVRFPSANAPACPAAAGWVLDAFGGIHPVGGAPLVTTAAYWPGWDIARDLAVAPGAPGGYVLDGFGGLHPFGGAPAVAAPSYRPWWDIARAAVRRSDGSVVVLDGQGGIAVTGGVPIEVGRVLWPRLDVARDLVLDPVDPGRAYVLDAYGAVHAVGTGAGVVDVVSTRATPGRDRARELLLLPGPTARGYVVDADGRLDAWAAGGAPLPPPLALATTTGSGQGAVVAPDGSVRVLTGSGAVVPTGDTPCAAAGLFPGDADLGRALAVASTRP